MNVVLIAAQSLDGFITFHDMPGSKFTSPADKAHFRGVLQQFPTRVMGSGSYQASREAIRKTCVSGTRQIVMTRRPNVFAGEVVPGLLEFWDITPAQLVARLAEDGCASLALIGGSRLHAAFVRESLVNEYWITIEPRLFGRGKSLLAGDVDQRLVLRSVEHLSADTLLLKYTPAENHN